MRSFMKYLVPRSTIALVALGMVVSLPTAVNAQEEEVAEQPYVYSSYWQIPWSRVDSLTKLLKLYPWTETAIEMGHITNRVWLVHHTGAEYNIVISTVYPTWEAMGEGARIGQVFQALEPDSLRREEVNAGFSWVFNDEGGETSHHDVIYRLMETP